MSPSAARLIMDAMVAATRPSTLTPAECLDRAAERSEERRQELRAMSDRRSAPRSTPDRRA
ncbi:MAG: hypothetical protein QOF36_2605 [Microbacteriaceae bacterium]|jgi:hypothetical protein|nr:hypothetical protein [Microbacteriaceae bacterium]